MSGGVDSSVAAALLVEQGFDVVGVMLRLWSEPPAPVLGGTVEAATNRCCSVESIHDARSVADRLGIPFYVIDAQAPFKQNVVDAWMRDYLAGLTPNPCLNCNRTIRFGHLLNYARSLGARYLATGHYAQVRQAGGEHQLWRGADRGKDQSYVLSVLGENELGQALFPVGGYTKPQVRGLAAERGLPTASRVESQDLCFVEDGDYRRFLGQHSGDAIRPGPIVTREGRTLGEHRGLPFYTIGQRSGLGIPSPQPLYVLELDVTNNALIVGVAAELGGTELHTGAMNWIGAVPTAPFDAEVQIRYRAKAAAGRVYPQGGGGVRVEFASPVRDITPGQAAVIYAGDRCLGSGLIAPMPS